MHHRLWLSYSFGNFDWESIASYTKIDNFSHYFLWELPHIETIHARIGWNDTFVLIFLLTFEPPLTYVDATVCQCTVFSSLIGLKPKDFLCFIIEIQIFCQFFQTFIFFSFLFTLLNEQPTNLKLRFFQI